MRSWHDWCGSTKHDLIEAGLNEGAAGSRITIDRALGRMNGSGSSASRGATLALWGKRFLVHQQLQKVTRFRRGLAIFRLAPGLAISARGYLGR